MQKHSQKKYYIIYKIVNTINGFEYIGQHSTNNLNDGYMGSGTFLKYEQKIFGIENFQKTILFVFDNFEDMDKKEKELVNTDFLKKPNVYNLCLGGFGKNYEYVCIRNIKLKKNKSWPAGKPILQKMIDDGWEFGVYMTPAKKKANERLNAAKAKRYMYDGKEYTLIQLLAISEKHITKRCLSNRLEHLKWSVHDSITIPPFKVYPYNGKMLTLGELRRELKIPASIIKQRLASGWNADDIKKGYRTNIPVRNESYRDSSGNKHTLDELSKISGYHKISILHKIKYAGISVDDILNGKCRKNNSYKTLKKHDIM